MLAAVALILVRLRIVSAGIAVAAGTLLAVPVLVVTSHYPVIAVAAVATAAVIGAGAGYAADGWRSPALSSGLAVVDGLLVAWLLVAMAYLSVPDTEGAVLVGAYLSVVGIAWYVGRWPTDATSAGAAVGSALAAAIVTAIVGGIGPSSIGGWWVAKALATLAVAASVHAAHRRFTANEPVHPSP